MHAPLPQALSVLFWCLIGGYFAWQGTVIGVGRISSPESGLMPFVAGVVLAGFGLVRLVEIAMKRDAMPAGEGLRGWRAPLATLVVGIFYALALERIGYLATTFLLLFVLTWVLGRVPWSKAALVAAAATGISWLIFARALGVSLP